MTNFNILFFLLLTSLLFSSCTTLYQDKEFTLEEIKLLITFPGNTKIEYDGPSHNEDQPRYDMSYNDGNSSHNSVAMSLEKIVDNHPNLLISLKEAIEQDGGTITKEFVYDNGFTGCTYDRDGSHLFKFIRKTNSEEAYLIAPNEIYNNEHQYLPVMLKAIESIEDISA